MSRFWPWGLCALSTFSLLAMHQGETPLLWIGMRDGGVASLAVAGWTTIDSRNSSLPFDSVYSLAETGPPERPTLWFGTETGGGVARWCAPTPRACARSWSTC